MQSVSRMHIVPVSNPLRLEGDEQEYKKFLVLAEVSNPLRLEGDKA